MLNCHGDPYSHNVPNEAIPEVNPFVPEPNQVVDIHDPNEMVDIPDDIDLVDCDEEDPEEDPEEEPEEDFDIELENDAELIFPYEVEGDRTPPPGDEDNIVMENPNILRDRRAIPKVNPVVPETVVLGATADAGAGGAGRRWCRHWQRPEITGFYLRNIHEVDCKERDKVNFATATPPRVVALIGGMEGLLHGY
ncbi:hypothetical protein Tco_1273737 [Tanacetum coccineum]